ncbi:MAG: UDP-N-acetylglucosamine 1-carboxyvinyltransferase [Oscillospiraceae bacterium]|nr:UDP-N-acetylglucosamine 1-carboxyvinyltransferase [Oscillospiraceae bacterium]
MEQYRIRGGNRLQGALKLQGAKNSALPILAAALLPGGVSEIHNCPQLSDTRRTLDILEHLGCGVSREGDVVTVDPSGAYRWEVPAPLVRSMRSSIIFLGAMVARFGRARLTYPGGCELGPRPIDLHLCALRQMAVQVEETGGDLWCTAPQGLCGARIVLLFPSVGATENILLAAATARGVTRVTNAAREPEIVDLADYLIRRGAKISGAGEGELTVEGVPRLCGAAHRIMGDRIAAATYLAAAAATGGSLSLCGAAPGTLAAVLPVLEKAGCQIETAGQTIALRAPERLRPLGVVRTMPYPGFPTDAQAPFLALSLLARGSSVFVENIFESRYKHVAELRRMGGRVEVEGRVAVAEGLGQLHSADVAATELRGGAALVLAALAAQGESRVSGAGYIDRGYEKFEDSLLSLGAEIQRMPWDEKAE